MSALADIKCDNAGYSRHYLMMTEYDPLAAFYFDESHITSSLRLFGEHLREARLRRNMTIEQIAKKLGVSRETVANAEHGKPSTSVRVYVGILWALGIADQLDDLATVEREYEELAVKSTRKRART